MKIQRVILSFGVFYFCCSSNYANRIFLKSDEEGIQKINYTEWEKVSSKKEMNLKQLPTHVPKEVESFLANLPEQLKKHKTRESERRIRTLPSKKFNL